MAVGSDCKPCAACQSGQAPAGRAGRRRCPGVWSRRRLARGGRRQARSFRSRGLLRTDLVLAESRDRGSGSGALGKQRRAPHCEYPGRLGRWQSGKHARRRAYFRPRATNLPSTMSVLACRLPSGFASATCWRDSITNWGEHVGTRQASYTNLPPASYRFRLAAANPDGVWSVRDATLRVSGGSAVLADVVVPVEPAGGFILTCWLCTTSALTGWLSNSRLFEERVGERTRIARELHDTLLQSFHGLNAPSPGRGADAAAGKGQGTDGTKPGTGRSGDRGRHGAPSMICAPLTTTDERPGGSIARGSQRI